MRFPDLLLGCLLAILLAAPAARAVDTTQLPTPEQQQRYSALTHEFRCMQCQNESIADSPVSLAADLRREVADMIVAGKSDDEIRDFMVARYGEFILFKPRFSARTAWLWLAPAILLLVGGFIAWRVVRQRSALVAHDDSPLDEDARA